MSGFLDSYDLQHWPDDEDFARETIMYAARALTKLPVGGSVTIERHDPAKQQDGRRYTLIVREPTD